MTLALTVRAVSTPVLGVESRLEPRLYPQRLCLRCSAGYVSIASLKLSKLSGCCRLWSSPGCLSHSLFDQFPCWLSSAASSTRLSDLSRASSPLGPV